MQDGKAILTIEGAATWAIENGELILQSTEMEGVETLISMVERAHSLSEFQHTNFVEYELLMRKALEIDFDFTVVKAVEQELIT